MTKRGRDRPTDRGDDKERNRGRQRETDIPTHIGNDKEIIGADRHTELTTKRETGADREGETHRQTEVTTKR